MPILRSPDRRESFPARALLLAGLIALGAAVPSHAQFLYLDANGDGINTSADTIAPSGPTSLDIWFWTDTNANNLPATCPSGDGPLSIAGYEFIVRASNGTVSWDSYANQVAAFTTPLGAASSTTEFRTGFSGPSSAAGIYRLGTLTVTPTSGTPSLSFES
ncbi:MAG TPA: hypothetical protein VFT32_10660, partial [Candidatus Eisenbacteria bacterium]|nr:hypothetical protein [Candidatus Eisenbacteria bacterium]